MFTSIFDSVMKEASIAPYVSKFNAFVDSLGVPFPVMLIALCLVVGLFGRRLSGLVRFTLLFAIGFVASVYWICPLIAPVVPQIPGYAVGLAVGLFAAVMSNLIYNAVYIGAIGFDTYNICFTGMLLAEVTAFTKGNLTVSVCVAVAVTLVALILRKYLEMLITAAAGGVGVAFFVSQLYDYTAKLGMQKMTAVLLVGAVLALPMFIYQYRHRGFF